ncbi:YesL family protein [Pseudalkalibacillus salsuginis]|uniref:YesL family protein n=1 Tax=Pseudalkalibacillus salsuginis TaxID=2910972 RepID=UPI001F3A64FC|nr:YesL family protein [Pseudalkalibacillus salsuginis]MCF6409092.1 YesL family protein [Pseudalkalibacillus salsuginis]
MKGEEIVSTFDLIFSWIMRLAVLNVLWFLYSLLGLFVGGIFPATVAALGVSRKWINGELDIKVRRTFDQIYRQEFVNSNILGWLLFAVGVLLYFSYQVIVHSAGEITFIIPFVFYLVLFFYVIIVLWSFPLLVHYQATWFHQIKNALIIGLINLHYTFASGLVVFAVAYFSLVYPGVIPFFSIGVAALGCMWLSMKIFWKLDQHLS